MEFAHRAEGQHLTSTWHNWKDYAATHVWNHYGKGLAVYIGCMSTRKLEVHLRGAKPAPRKQVVKEILQNTTTNYYSEKVWKWILGKLVVCYFNYLLYGTVLAFMIIKMVYRVAENTAARKWHRPKCLHGCETYSLKRTIKVPVWWAWSVTGTLLAPVVCLHHQ